MPFFKKKPKTSHQKAQQAQTRALVRVIACGWLVYVVFQMLTTPPEESGMSPALRIATVVFFICAGALLITLTIVQFVQNFKSGYFKESSHEDDPGIIGTVGKNIKTDEEDDSGDELTEKFDEEDDDSELTEEFDDGPDESDKE